MFIKLLLLTLGLTMVQAASAEVKTLVCSQGNVNLVMQLESGWISEAELINTVTGKSLGSVDRNDISLSPGEAYIRTDVEYDATGPFTNCH